MRRIIRPPWVWLGGIALIGLILTPIVAHRTHRPQDTPQTTPPAGCVAAPKPWSVTEAFSTDDLDNIRVTEQGHTLLGNPDDPGAISIGAILANTADRVAYRTDILIEVDDGDGKNVLRGSESVPLHLWIPVMEPGERIGVGVTRPLLGSAGRVSAVTIKAVSTHWSPAPDQDSRFAQVTVDLQSMRDIPTAPGSAFIDYIATSRYCRPVTQHGVSLIFRNKSGEIVGGTLEYLPDTYISAESGCQPGQQRKSDELIVNVPENVDNTQTTAYAYCDSATEYTEIRGVLNYTFNITDGSGWEPAESSGP